MKYLVHLSLLIFAAMSLSGQNLFSGGDGSQSNPYQIANEKDLRNLAKEVNNKRNNFKDKYFKQTADITFNFAEPIEPIGGPVSEDFTRPDESCFQGHYDGGMKKIFNLNLYDVTELDGGEDAHIGVGLFGDLGQGATLKNIVIASGNIYAFSHVGAIVGTLHEKTQISHCKVGPDVRVTAWSDAGGIVGCSIGKDITISQCANYANVNVHGQGQYKSAGGIIASGGNVKIEGCANFGDIWAGGGFAGGIIGYMPLSTPDFQFTYPELKSCINAGDITSIQPASGGLIGAVGYNVVNEDGSPRPHQQISNSYSYGQTWAAYSKTNGPVVAFFFKNTPITVAKTFYNKDRFRITKELNNADSEIAFSLGEAKSHQEMTSEAFLTTLNGGAPYPFESDKHKFNANMPVLKWLNDSYDPTIDKPNQYRTDVKQSLYERKANIFFRPNREGKFLIYNNDMQQPNVQSKSFGCSTDRVWVDRILSTKGGETYTFFLSSSAFRKKIGEDGMYVKEKIAQTADHWFITPEFEVTGNKAWFHWVAGSEDSDVPGAYEVYVAEASADKPENYKNLQPIFKTEAEEAVINKEEKDAEGKTRVYYELHPRKVDLSAHIGKKVRIAFRDNSTDKFFLMIGRFATDGEILKNAPICFESKASVSIENQIIVVTTTELQRIEIYNLEGICLAQGMGELLFQAEPAIYLVRTIDASGYGEVRKVIVK